MSLKRLQHVLRLIRKNAQDPQNLGSVAQMMEMLRLRALNGIGPNYYLLAGFSAKDLPWALKASHKSAAAYKKWINAKNPPLYRKISQNKLAECAVLHLMKIPTTRYLGFLNLHCGVTQNGKHLRDSTDLLNLLTESGCKTIVCKPLEGSGGKGIRVFNVESSNGESMTLQDRVSGETIRLDKTEKNLDPLLRSDEGWILEDYFEQHPTIARINPSSVNTIRMWVARRSNRSKAECIAGYLRIGRSGAVVDNQSSGGVVCPIDFATGVLGKTQSGTVERLLFTSHPDHGAAIEGVTIPFWEACKALAETALTAFPEMYFCGLDIAVGPAGPVIIELNPSPDKEGAAFMQIPFPD